MSVQGPIPVEFGTVFPSGAYAAGAFDPVRNFDASTGEKFVQSHDKATGAPLWVIEVIDPDPASPDPGGQGQGRRPGPAGRPHRAARVAVRPGGVHRDDRHPVREPGRAAGLLAQGNRHPGTRPRPTRTRDQGGSRVRSGGGSFGQISLHVGAGLVDVPEHLRRPQPDPRRRRRVDHGDVHHRRPQGQRLGAGVRPGTGQPGSRVRRRGRAAPRPAQPGHRHGRGRYREG